MPPSPPRCVATPQHAAAPTRSPPPRRRCRMRARDLVGRSGCPAAPRTRKADSERPAPSSGSSRDCWRSRWARRCCPPATSPPTRTTPPSASNTTTRYFLEFLMCDRVTLAACWSWEKEGVEGFIEVFRWPSNHHKVPTQCSASNRSMGLARFA